MFDVSIIKLLKISRKYFYSCFQLFANSQHIITYFLLVIQLTDFLNINFARTPICPLTIIFAILFAMRRRISYMDNNSLTPPIRLILLAPAQPSRLKKTIEQGLWSISSASSFERLNVSYGFLHRRFKVLKFGHIGIVLRGMVSIGYDSVFYLKSSFRNFPFNFFYYFNDSIF